MSSDLSQAVDDLIANGKNAPIRVTFCTYDSPKNVSGPNAWLLRLLPKLKVNGIISSVLIFSLDPSDSPTAEALSHSGLDVSVFKFKSTTRSKIKWILENIARHPPDVFVPNLVIPAYFAAGYLKDSGIATVGVLHSDDSFYHALLKEFTRKDSFYCLSGLVCVSEFLEASAKKNAADSVAIYRIPCGVPVPLETAAAPAKIMSLIFVGRLEEEQKRISDVTRSLCSVTQRVPGVDAYIYGDGPDADAVRSIIKEEKASDRVTLVGRVSPDQIQSRMLGSHVIVLLSDYEGLPVALMEGMACGLVPVCKDIASGIPELVSNGVNGLVVSDGGESFESAVRRLRSSPDIWQKLSDGAKQTILDAFSNEICADKWSAVLRAQAAGMNHLVSLEFPPVRRLPKMRRQFMREDFRGHHFITRALNRILRVMYLGGNR